MEIVDPHTNEILAVAEAYWPQGLQPGLGQPVILELDPEEADLDGLASLGIRMFESINSLRHHVETESRAAAGGSSN